MSDDTRATDASHAPPAGWVLRAGSGDLDLDGLLERFGQIHRVPVASGSTLEVGTPCFLVRTDRNRVVGLWAVGEVVAPVLDLPAGTEVLPAESLLGAIDAAVARSYAEVELLALAKPIALASLLEDARLARSELATDPDLAEPRAPVPLRIGEVRALEATEWWIDEPSEAQRAELDRLLAAEDPILDALEAAPPG